MSSDDQARRRIDGIFDGLADSIADDTPEELLDEAREAGQNLRAIADEIKNVLHAALKKFEQRKLEAAREACRLRSQCGPNEGKAIGSTADERKRQLSAILESNPEIGAVLTAQHREFETLTDEDVTSTLEDLAELGFLNDVPRTSDEG